jgi:Ca-activated chloride channel family protein
LLLAAQPPTFTVSARVVEIHATVLDKRDRHVRSLTLADFDINDGGRSRPPEKLEADSSPFSLALLLDTTGSMEDAMPSLKQAAAALVEKIRPEDNVALYGFSDRFDEILPFSRDHRAALLAIRRLRASGKTALFDALARAGQKLGARSGKKALVVFSDGIDNSSVLTMNSAIERARREAVPVYAVAQGQALRDGKLMDALESISSSSGGQAFKVRKLDQMAEVFEEVSGDLLASYLLSFTPAHGSGEWRPLRVSVKNQPSCRVRHRAGYFAD